MVPETIYRPDSELRDPLRLVRDICTAPWKGRAMIWVLLRRDLAAQYRESLLGWFWAFVPPLLTALIASQAQRARLLSLGETDIPYAAYVVLGMCLWQTFSQSVEAPVQSLRQALPILARMRLAWEIPVLAKMGEVGVNFCARLLLVAAVFAWYGVPVTWASALALPAALVLAVMGMAFGLLLAPFALLAQDVSRALTVGLGLWMLATPVLYASPTSGALARFVAANPVAPILVTARELATGTAPSQPGLFGLWTLAAMLGFAVAAVIYRVAMPRIVERVGI